MKKMKMALVLLALVTAAGCGAKQAEVKKPVVKSQMPLWRLIMYKQPGLDEIRHEDKWFVYSVDLEKVVKGPNSFTNRLYGECRYQGANFTVVDKDTHLIVKEMHVDQMPCNNCHKR